MAHRDSSVGDFLQHYATSQKIHAKSLISTFFGDLAVPHGGKAWVETIASLLEPLGVSNRLVRTSLFRLADEQWLESTRVGRRSYYELSAKAIGQTELAEKLIYYQRKDNWDGQWTLIFIVKKPENTELRSQLEQELGWIGFGAIARHIYAHPTASVNVVADRVKALGLNKNVVCMKANNISEGVAGLDVSDLDVAAMCLPMENIEQRYKKFIALFSVVEPQEIQYASEIEVLCLRLILIDEYRRAVLKDPHLPVELLPQQWIGYSAHLLCRQIYNALLDVSNAGYRQILTGKSAELLGDYQQSYAGRFR